MMITPARLMQPLPVRPVDGTVRTAAPAPFVDRTPGGCMQPLPLPQPDLADAIRANAFERMLDRLGLQQPLQVIDPTI